MQTVVQVICSGNASLREAIVRDKKNLKKFKLMVSSEKVQGRNPGWAKLHSTDYETPGALNIIWYGASNILIGRVVTRSGNTPDDLIGTFISYLLARYRRRIRAIHVLPD